MIENEIYTFLTFLFLGCDEAHGLDHSQGSARQQLLQRPGQLRGGHPAGEDTFTQRLSSHDGHGQPSLDPFIEILRF